MRSRGAPRMQGLTALAIVAALAALTAGCGSSSKSAATTAAPAAPSPASVTQPAPSASTPAPATTAAPTTTAGQGSNTATSTSQTGGTPAGSGGGGSQAQSCPNVVFVQATSHGAFQVSTTGASCSTAQAVAGAAKSCFGCRYSAQGFQCTGHEVTTGLIRVNYTCTQGSDRITFVRG